MLTRYVYIEERAAALRLRLGLTSWMSVQQTPLLLKWASPLVTVRRCGVEQASWRPARGGRHRILVPEQLSAWQRNRLALHEMAHALLDVGFSAIAQSMDDQERLQYRVAARADKHEEELADELILAIRMPMHLVAEINDAEKISELTELPWNIADRRVRRVNGEVLRLNYLPAWCAARRFRLELHTGPTESLVLLDTERPRLRIPVSAKTRADREVRLKGDLLAMRPQEILAKYRSFAVETLPALCRRPRWLPVQLDELQAWSADLARRRTYQHPTTH
ncbi:MAG: hypothetical protein ACK47B_23565 [Armatimonadota bacterium]